jgi:glycosyltransferase involved in cell wall biosynthesis
MTVIQHIVDRALDCTATWLLRDVIERSSFTHEQILVDPKSPLPPTITGDIIVLHISASWSRLPFLFLLREEVGKRPLIIVEGTYSRCFEHQCVKNRRRFHSLLRLSYGLADAVVVLSMSQTSWLVDCELAPRNKIVTVSPPTDRTAHSNVLPPATRDGGPLRIAAHGSLSRRSGFDVLIEAMRLLPPGVAVAEIAGAGGNETQLRQAAAQLGTIEFTSVQTDIGLFLARSDVVVIPSRWEVSGDLLCEARAAARPVIATSVDVLADEITVPWGELVAPDDPHALADAIIRTACRPLHDLGLAARSSLQDRIDDGALNWSQLLAVVA